MSILKKTMFAGLAAIALASAGTAATTTSAEAGYRYYNSYNFHNHGCYYKKVWKAHYYGWGHGRWVKVKICY